MGVILTTYIHWYDPPSKVLFDLSTQRFKVLESTAPEGCVQAGGAQQNRCVVSTFGMDVHVNSKKVHIFLK